MLQPLRLAVHDLIGGLHEPEGQRGGLSRAQRRRGCGVSVEAGGRGVSPEQESLSGLFPDDVQLVVVSQCSRHLLVRHVGSVLLGINNNWVRGQTSFPIRNKTKKPLDSRQGLSREEML